jgi:hypothetical protein
MASEHEIQVSLMAWLKLKHPHAYNVTYATPNAGKRTPRQGAYLKAEGLKAGVPDICIAYPKGGYGALYIELKKEGGKPTIAQNEWLDRLSNVGNKAVLCVGFTEAANTIDEYLRG